MRSGARPRVGIISIHPAPYRDSTLACLYRRKVVIVKVVTMYGIDQKHRFWNLAGVAYPNIFLGTHMNLGRRRGFHPRITSVLKKGAFDVIIIPGYQHITCWYAILYCLLTNTPFVFSLDTRSDHVRARIKAAVTRALYRRAAAFWVPGKASREFLISQGVADERIFEGYYNLDAASIRKQQCSLRRKRSDLRSSVNIAQDRFVFLMVANAIGTRRHDLLLDSFSRVRAVCSDAYLLLVGTGTQELIKRRTSKGKESHGVQAIGPVGWDSLARFYAVADAYVHSGGEPYSTAVEYAAIVGLPIVTTFDVGAAKDYVIEGKTGYVVSSNDACALAEKMLCLAQDRELARRCGLRSGERARTFTADWAAQQIELAVQRALSLDCH